MMALHARAATGLVIGALLFTTFGFLACSSEEPEPQPGAGDGGAVTDPEPLFRIVQKDLIARCGGPNGGCHVRGASAPHWLGDPDPYLSAKKYPGILPATRDPGDSTILTQIDHVGPTLKRYPELYSHTAEWIAAELPKPALPNTGAFNVSIGLNVINLNTLGSGLDGARITFLAAEGSAGTLLITALRMQAPQNANIKIESPFFVILPRSGKVKAEPTVNGFQGELTVPAGTSADFYTGRMILTGWDAAGQLKITFNKIESTPGQGPSGNCTALDVFTAKAIPAFRATIDITGDDDIGPGYDGGKYDGGIVGQGSCVTCHAKATPPGESPSTAVSAMDLRAIDTDPAAACGQARNFVNLQNKAQSIILLNPTGKANEFHPVKPLPETHPVVKDLAEWVNAEKP
jgi:hypothetical protein